MNADTPHSITVRSSATPYGCKDRKYSPGYYAPQRETLPDGNFRMTTRYLLHKMSVGCRYDQSFSDPRCEGCKHRATDKEDTR